MNYNSITSQSTNAESNTYWQEQREYFKEKTLAFKELKKKRELEIMMKELNKNKKQIKINGFYTILDESWQVYQK